MASLEDNPKVSELVARLDAMQAALTEAVKEAQAACGLADEIGGSVLERVAGSLKEVTIPTLERFTTGKFQEGSAADLQLFLRCELFGEHEGLTSP